MGIFEIFAFFPTFETACYPLCSTPAVLFFTCILLMVFYPNLFWFIFTCILISRDRRPHFFPSFLREIFKTKAAYPSFICGIFQKVHKISKKFVFCVRLRVFYSPMLSLCVYTPWVWCQIFHENGRCGPPFWSVWGPLLVGGVPSMVAAGLSGCSVRPCGCSVRPRSRLHSPSKQKFFRLLEKMNNWDRQPYTKGEPGLEHNYRKFWTLRVPQ